MPEQQPQRAESAAVEPSTAYAESILNVGVNDQVPEAIQNLLARDYPLANIDGDDREYFRLLSENIRLYIEEEFPPEESLVQGDLGAALLEDPSYSHQALTPTKKTRYETILMDSYARSSRGVSGWQQEQFSKSTNVRRVEDNRGGAGDSSGFLGELFS
jgi:hypothetical protein